MAMPASRFPSPVRRLARSSVRRLVPCLALLAAAGCAVPANVREGTLVGKQFTVKESSLNWAEIAYTPVPGDPDFRYPCRLSLNGSGEVQFRTGRSPQVFDDFSHKVNDPYWNDLVEDRVHIGEEKMREVFQQLVDAGVFQDDWRRMSAGEEPRPPMARIRAKVDGNQTLRVVDNRRVIRIVEGLLEPFAETARAARGADGPAFRRRNR